MSYGGAETQVHAQYEFQAEPRPANSKKYRKYQDRYNKFLHNNFPKSFFLNLKIYGPSSPIDKNAYQPSQKPKSLTSKKYQYSPYKFRNQKSNSL